MSGLHHTDALICELCQQKLAQAHPLLSEWFRIHVKPNFQNAHVSWSFRSRVDQEQAVADGKSRLHWPYSPHNKQPALALDLFEIDEDHQGVWNPKFFSDLNEVTLKAGVPLIWGGTFKTLGDRDHWEIAKVRVLEPQSRSFPIPMNSA